jgi:NCAIR mutase (PurE)-related protein
MTTTEAARLLEQFRAGKIPRDKVLSAFQAAPVADLGFAQVDTHRALRKNFPEVIFGAGKTPEQVVKIAAQLVALKQPVLVTRINADYARALKRKFKHAVYHALARCAPSRNNRCPSARASSPWFAPAPAICRWPRKPPLPPKSWATASSACKMSAWRATPDAGAHGVAPSANVIVAVAGMEGALPSVLAGLVAKPVIAVPTSVGYGASFGGIAALLAMLNSCASGVTVVNIDNGFGAGYAASQINALVETK